MQEYRFKFYLNAIHSIEINDVMGKEHPHTWEIGIEAFKSDDSFIMFTDIEKAVENTIAPFQDKNMNLVSPFDVINPTLENVSFYFKNKIEQLLIDKDWMLTRIEVSETPSRTFVIDLKNSTDTNEIKSSKREILFKTVEEEAERVAREKNKSKESILLEPVITEEDIDDESIQKDKKKFFKNKLFILCILSALIIVITYFITNYILRIT